MISRLKKLNSFTRKLTGDFKQDTDGAIALVFGLAAVPMILAAGAALDYVRVGSATAEVQAALDASALAGAAASPSSTDDERRQFALDAFNANLEGGFAPKLTGGPVVSFNDGRITVAYHGGLPTTLLRLGGFDEFNVSATSTATMNRPGRAEIAMVLDYSGSMGWMSAGSQKYVTMRNAAIDMVNGLTDNGTNSEIRFGLVPFSHNVFTQLPANFVVGATGSTWTGCTYDRMYPHNTTAAEPTASNATKWGQPAPSFPPGDDQGKHHCDGKNHDGNGYQANNLEVRELSSSHSDTISQLQAMRPYGYTNISLGTEFGWHLLEPGAPFAARSFADTENKKFLVVLTDGEQTTPAFGNGASRTVPNGGNNLASLCDNIKSAGNITVITIAFALSDTATENRLRNCATDPDRHFFEAEDGNDLTKAFEEIQRQIATAIYLSE